MTLWIGTNALEDLNNKWSTPILNDDGEPTGGTLGVGLNGNFPNISNLFGDNEVIWLDSLKIDEAGDAHCKVSGQEDSDFIIYSWKSGDIQTEWVKK